MSMPKHVKVDDWEGKWSSRDGSDGIVKIVAWPDDPAEKAIQFLIEKTLRPSREEIAISLFVRMSSGERVPLCRYEIQVNRHFNKHKWFLPRVIEAREPHRQVYNPRAVKEGTPSDWDDCAEPLNIGSSGSPKQLADRLLMQFVKDVELSFHDRSAQQSMFGDKPDA